jgi:RNA polymerase-associated protein
MNTSVVTKRSSMVFFSDGLDHYSHRVRIVLAEKGVSVEVVDVDPNDVPAEVADLNPYNEVPTLVDRELVIYEPNVMMEYLDERFPHPPLLPVYPVARAQSRQYLQRIKRDWCGHIDTILAGKEKEATIVKLRKELRDSLLSLSPIFEQKPFFMSDEFTVVDCAMAPILWRLPLLGIEVPPKQGKGLLKYCERLFRRDGFQASLSDREREIRQPY